MMRHSVALPSVGARKEVIDGRQEPEEHEQGEAAKAAAQGHEAAERAAAEAANAGEEVAFATQRRGSTRERGRVYHGVAVALAVDGGRTMGDKSPKNTNKTKKQQAQKKDNKAKKPAP